MVGFDLSDSWRLSASPSDLIMLVFNSVWLSDFELVEVDWSASPWGLMVVVVSAALLGALKLKTDFDFVTGRLTSSSASLFSLIVPN